MKLKQPGKLEAYDVSLDTEIHAEWCGCIHCFSMPEDN